MKKHTLARWKDGLELWVEKLHALSVGGTGLSRRSRARRNRKHGNFVPGVESLEPRVLMAYSTVISTAANANVSVATSGSTVTYTATGTGAKVQVADILTRLQNGAVTTVVITNGSGGSESGNITWNASANLDYNGIGAAKSLQIISDSSSTVGAVTLNSNITDSSPGGESLAVSVSARSTLDLLGSVATGGGDISLTNAADNVYVDGALDAGSAGDITVTAAGSIGSAIFNANATSGSGTITATAGHHVILNSNAASLSTTGDVSLTATNGTISESGTGIITCDLLSVYAGFSATTLSNSNAVTRLSAFGGLVTVNDAVSLLTVTAINGNGEVIQLTNTGAITTTGAVITAGGAGDVTLTAGGTITLGDDIVTGGYGTISTVTLIATGASSDILLNGSVRCDGDFVATAGRNVILGGSASVSNRFSTHLTATAGSISESGTGTISGWQLYTASATGTTLNKENRVSSFSATNNTSGDISLVSTGLAPQLVGGGVSDGGLVILGIAQTAGGSYGVSVSNSGPGQTYNTGAVTTSGNGGITLTTTGEMATLAPITAGGSGAVSLTAGIGNILYIEDAVSSTSGTISGAAGGSVSLYTSSASLSTSGQVSLTAGPAGLVLERVSGSSITAGLLTATAGAGITLTNSGNAVSSFAATSTGSGNIALTNTAAPLTLTGISQTAGTTTVTNTGGITTTGAVGGTSVTLTASNTITLGAGLTATAATGTVTLSPSAGGVNQTAGVVTANKLLLTGAGTFSLPATAVTTLAASVLGAVTLYSNRALTVGTVGSTNGIVTGNGGTGSNLLIGGASTVTINQAISTASGAGGTQTLGTGVTNNSTITLGGGNVTIAGGKVLSVLDVNKQVVLTPGVPENDFYNWSVSLLAQVSGTTASSYSWDLSQAALATSVSGGATRNLQFTWGLDSVNLLRTQTITLTVTNSDATKVSQTFTFNVWNNNSWGYAASPPTMPSGTWPVAVLPDALTPDQATITGYGYSLGVATGQVMAAQTLTAYNPGVAPVSLVYDSLAAEPKPVFLVYYQIDPSQAVPPTVKATLTLNGVTGTTYWYDTSASNGNAMLNPGDVLQIALQGDATALSTGRYTYSISVTANYGSPVTSTLSGSVDVINENGSPYGAGWTLDNVERVWSVTGGVILELPGGKSLWFASAGGGAYTTPAGDFSTLTSSGGNYTRTLKDGTAINFNSSGLQTSIVDRNGNTTTFSYTSTTLTAATDMNGLTTTLGYSSGKLTSITDPASRATTFAQDGSGRLTQVTAPDSAVWAYSYDSSSKRLLTVTDPRTHTATFAYNAAGRVTGVSRADGTSDSLTAVQVNGLVLSGGTSGNPAAPMLLVNAAAQYTDPRSKVWQTYTDWSGFGRATQTKDPLGDTAVTYRDANGLPWVSADPLGGRVRSFFDASGNVTKLVHEDDTHVQYAYNAYSQPTNITDEGGFTTAYAYDAHGNLTQLTQADPDLAGPAGSPVWNYTYTTKGSVSTQTDPLTHTTTYGYDSRNRLTAKTDPMTFTTSYGYDSASNLTSVTDPLTHTTAYGYDNVGRRTRMTDPLTHTTNYAYDATGNLTAVTDPLTHTTAYGYDSLNRGTRMTDPLTHTTNYAYDAAGNPTAITDPLTHTTAYAYDDAGRATATTDANTHTTVYGLDAKGQVLSVTDPLAHTTTYSYSPRGFQTGMTDATGRTTAQAFDAYGSLSTQSAGLTNQLTAGYAYDGLHRLTAYTDELGNTTLYRYDAAGNQLNVTVPSLPTMMYAYDADNRLTAETKSFTLTTSYGYDAAGNRTRVTDPLTHSTTWAYDAANRLTAQTDALTHTTTFGYDNANRQTGLTDPAGNVWTYGYDNADRKTAVTDPLTHTTTYAYDGADRLTSQTDRNGRQTNFGYDNVGHRTGETWISGGSPIYTAAYTYDAADRLTSESDNYSAYTYAYDNANRLTAASNAGTPGAATVVLNYTYDQYGRRTSLSDNHSNAVTYAYDAAGRVTQLQDAAGWVVRSSYDVIGRVTQIDRRDVAGWDPLGLVSTRMSYDSLDRIIGITHSDVAAGTGSTFTYAYDAASRITGYTGPEGSVTFTYDNTNQLTGASGARTETYTYDANGNRTMTGYSTTAGNRLTSDGTYNYTYDNEGNLTTQTKISDGSQTVYAYDYHNRLTDIAVKNSLGVTVTHDAFTYDVEGRRIAKAVNGTTTWTAYDGPNPWADFNNAGTQTEHYLYGLGIDELFARYDGTTWAWYLTDNVGSVRQIMGTTGTVLDRIDYDSFGNITNETTPANGDRFKFTSREWDSEVNQFSYRARSYSPIVARFLSEDPVAFAATDANLYRYVGNHPVMAADPTGKDELDDLQRTRDYAATSTERDAKLYMEAGKAYAASRTRANSAAWYKAWNNLQLSIIYFNRADDRYRYAIARRVSLAYQVLIAQAASTNGGLTVFPLTWPSGR